MKFLVGDIGNTSTKICILNTKFRILRSYNFETNEMYRSNFFNVITRKKINKNLNSVFLFSSVVPKVLGSIKKKFKSTNYKILELKNLNLNKVIKINVKNKKQLGSDRIANAIGAKKFKNCLVLDFGTATTFDVIKNGVYEGGVIAPGVKLSIKNLSKATALLPSIDLKANQKRDEEAQKAFQQQQAQMPQQEQPYQPVDYKAEDWAEKNTWFVSDRAMTATAMSYHDVLLQEGFDPTSDEYYTEINSYIREEFPHKF